MFTATNPVKYLLNTEGTGVSRQINLVNGVANVDTLQLFVTGASKVAIVKPDNSIAEKVISIYLLNMSRLMKVLFPS